MSSMVLKGFAALSHGSIGGVIRVVIQFGVAALLARLLGPTPFGIFALCLLCFGASKIFSDLGLSAALIQAPSIDQQHVNASFTIHMILGASLAIALALSSERLANALGQPEAGMPLSMCGLLFILHAFSQVPQALLTRQLRVGELQKAQISSYMIGYAGYGIVASLAGLGVWSLVGAQVIQSAVYACVLHRLARSHIRIGSTRPALTLLRFGYKVTIANITSWLLGNVDVIFVSRFFGGAVLGLYNRSQALILTPANVLASSLQTAVFATASRLDRGLADLRRAYLSTFELALGVSLPLFVSVAVNSNFLVWMTYGSKWVDAADILVPVALAAPFYIALCTVGPVLMAIDRVDLEIKAQSFLVIILLPLYVAAGRHSVNAVAWLMFAATLLRLGFLLDAICRTMGIGWLEILRCLIAPACVSVLAVCSMLVLGQIPLGPNVIVVDAAKMAVGFLAALAGTYAIAKTKISMAYPLILGFKRRAK